MRITLPSGTLAELVEPAAERPGAIGVVIAPDIFGLRPLYDDLVARLAAEWGVTVVAVEPFPGLDLGPDVETRFAAVPHLDDERHLADLEAAADAVGIERAMLLGFCMGGMYCFKAARSTASSGSPASTA
jgi:carboxymethylenebutenolidase